MKELLKFKEEFQSSSEQQLYLTDNSADNSIISSNYKKIKINKHLRNIVWNETMGEDNKKGKCWCCEDKILDVAESSWHVGHIVAQSQGGKLTKDNLKPICVDCNLGCGDHNLIEYKEAIKNFKSSN